MSDAGRRITLHRGESTDGDRVFLVRLDGTGVGALDPGDECVVSDPATDERRPGRVLSVEQKRLEELSEEDASRVLSPPANDLSSLRMRLRQYRFRPQWDQGETKFRILEIELTDNSNAEE